MPPQGDVPICGYGLAAGPLCHNDSAHGPRDPARAEAPWCLHHNQSRFRQCEGCGARANRECPSFTGKLRCGRPLCDSCEHQDFGAHGPRRTPADVALEELSAALGLVLKEAGESGLLTITEANIRPVARLIINRLSTHVTLKILSGLAAPPHDSSSPTA